MSIQSSIAYEINDIMIKKYKKPHAKVLYLVRGSCW